MEKKPAQVRNQGG